MLTILNKRMILALSVAVAVMTGCKKDAGQVATPSGQPSLTFSNTNKLVMLEDYQDSVIEKISWAPVNFGYNGVVTYTLQFDKKGNGFASPYNVAVTGTSTTMTVAALNDVAAALGLTFGQDNEMVARMRANVGTTNYLADAASISDSVSLVINPYRVIPKYPLVYVPGDYSDAYGLPTWDPGTAPSLAKRTSDAYYQGFLVFRAGSQFKINVARNWDDANYGGDASSLSTSGPNLSVADAGLYYLTANVDAKTWTHVVVSSFSLYGAATGNADKDLTATNAVKSLWSATVTLGAGTLDFRVNHDAKWTYGDTDADALLDPATTGNAINIAEASTYKITLDLSLPGNYIYTIEKQ